MALVRLDKFLSNAGIGSRSQVRDYIKFRRVWVDGSPCIKADTKIDKDKNVVTFDKRVVSYDEYVYIILNKPKGVISATEDEHEKTVIDLLDDKYKKMKLFPIGRLDKDTVGLLILSNDGRFAHNTLSPKKHIEKSYYAHINGKITEEHIKKFEEGVMISGGYKCLPAKLSIEYSADNFSKVNITIKEGKYHQIKRMFEAFGRKVVYLKRTSFDDITLDESLQEGEYRLANDEEMKVIAKFIEK